MWTQRIFVMILFLFCDLNAIQIIPDKAEGFSNDKLIFAHVVK